ncbi:MAG: YhcH/YjgK/YiaL family protein, partial [Victivallaceae bacterium]|nr:YhcH/YjgK/YiaL family protein [Victivallaceae bacterium]
MIFDSLNQFSSLHFLSAEDCAKLDSVLASLNADSPVGKIEIDGSRIFLSVSEYTTRNVEDAKLEAHHNYVDIQLLLAGKEQIGYSPLDNLAVTQEYDAKKDCAFYAYNPAGGTILTLTPGVFAVFFPNEGHMPCLAVGDRK